jgi:hypothetical protein
VLESIPTLLGKLHLAACKFSQDNPIIYTTPDDRFVDVKKAVESEQLLSNIRSSFPTLVSTPHQHPKVVNVTSFHIPVPPSLLYSLVYVYGLLCRWNINRSKILIENYKNALEHLAAKREVFF